MVAQVALNYGLFLRTVSRSTGCYDEADMRFLIDMAENTAREIYVNKFLLPNEFLMAPFDALDAVKQKRYCNAQINFINTRYQGIKPNWKFRESDKDSVAI